MKIVTDTNILFSILIKPSGKTFELFNSLLIKNTIFIAERTITELSNHSKKILKLSHLSESEVSTFKKELLNRCKLIKDLQLPSKAIQEAYNLVKDVDLDDAAFVATTIFLKAVLWSSDKPLKKALQEKGFNNIFDSEAIQIFL